MRSCRRWLLLGGALFVVPACAARPPRAAAATGASASDPRGAGSLVERQIRAGRASLLDGISEPQRRKALMKELSRDLGLECDGCHDVADFRAPTPQKAVATQMFARFSLGLQWKGGAAATCVSCHDGQARLLGGRDDRERIARLMKARFVDRLERRGGGEVECATCHGDRAGRPFLERSKS